MKQNRIGREIAFEQKEYRDFEWIKLLVRMKQEKIIQIEWLGSNSLCVESDTKIARKCSKL